MNKQEMEQKFIQLYRKADYATRKKIDRKIQRIIAKGKGENLRKKAFFQAVKDGNKRAVENILSQENHVDVNSKDERLGNTPLNYAVSNNHADLAKLLLDAGADPMIENNRGKNSLDATRLAIDKLGMVKLLSKYSDCINKKDTMK